MNQQTKCRFSGWVDDSLYLLAKHHKETRSIFFSFFYKSQVEDRVFAVTKLSNKQYPRNLNINDTAHLQR